MKVIRFLRGVLWVLSRVPKILFTGLLGLFGWLRAPKRERIVPERETTARAEWAVILLLLGAAAAGLAFFVFYVIDISNSTQFLGLALGVCLALIAAALIVGAKQARPDRARGGGVRQGGPRGRGAGATADPREPERDYAAAADSGGRGGRRRRARARPDRPGCLDGPPARHGVALRLALASGTAPGG